MLGVCQTLYKMDTASIKTRESLVYKRNRKRSNYIKAASRNMNNNNDNKVQMLRKQYEKAEAKLDAYDESIRSRSGKTQQHSAFKVSLRL